ncbi:lytic transglycosylase domain-containing protein [Nocardioides dilutus]
MRAARVAAPVAMIASAVAGLGFAAAQTVTAPRQLEPSLSLTPQEPALQTEPVETLRVGPPGPPRVDEAWVAVNATNAGIPLPALRAYANAQLDGPEGCRVGWTTLAGIGWVESQHGTVDGRTLGGDGRPSTPILGPALDGEPFAAIAATPETTLWHGDPDWDHAVGPMQFIPSTWSTWGQDGDGDGVADPNDIDDAAATAVAYLCADGHDLTSGAGWADAIFGYNHDDSYVASVHAAASEYAARTS